MNTPRHVPSCYLLSQAELSEIDESARNILDQVGVAVQDPAIGKELSAAGARLNADTGLITFPGTILDALLAKAPSQVTLYSRDGSRDLKLGSGRVHFANGGRVFRILDMTTGGYRLTMLRDVGHTASLVQRMNHIDMYIIACQSHDIPPAHYHLHDFYQAMNHTTKHVMGGCDTLDGVKQMHELASMIAGGQTALRNKPFVSVITNPISPLKTDSEVLNIFRFCCLNGIPVTCAPAPIAGATAPVTLAGTLVQMHAEALAAVAISQIFAPGAPVLYGAVPSTMDLRKMDYTMGSVEMAMMNAAAVQLAHLYRLPIYASAGVTEAKRPDVQSGCEKSFSNLLVALSGGDLVHLAAGMIDSGNSISYEQYVIDDEIIGMVRRLLGGISISSEKIGLDVIRQVGPGGNYALEDHTVSHMMEESFYPELGVRCNFDIWEESGRPSMLTRATEKVRLLLEEGKEGLLEPALIAHIEKRFPQLKGIEVKGAHWQ